MVALEEMMLDLHRRLLEMQVEAADREIDALVYDLAPRRDRRRRGIPVPSPHARERGRVHRPEQTNAERQRLQFADALAQSPAGVHDLLDIRMNSLTRTSTSRRVPLGRTGR